MNWQSILIGISSSIIGGVITLIGNVIIVKIKAKTKKTETENKYEHEYLMERFRVYSQLSCELEFIIEHHSEISNLKDTKFWDIYANNNLRIDNEVKINIGKLLLAFYKKTFIEQRCKTLISLMKNEIDAYYHLNNEK